MVESNDISYLGYHDPITGLPVGSSFRFLIGNSILHMLDGQAISYIFPDLKHAIL